MPSMEEQPEKRTIQDEIFDFERRLELPRGFYTRLFDEDDWSFVIKVSALLEAATTHVLVCRLGRPELDDDLTYVDYANPRCGRLKLLKSLGAISSEHYATMRKLAEIRNRIVHRVADVSFTFEKYVGSKSSKVHKDLEKHFGRHLIDPLALETSSLSLSDFVFQQPKLTIWCAVMEILACLNLEFEMEKIAEQKRKTEARLQILDAQAKLLNHLIPSLPKSNNS